MCGRYRLSRRKQIIEEHFETVSDEPDWNPRYNIAPTQPVPVIRQNPKEPRAGVVPDALGSHSLVVEGHVWRCHDD
jgi:putative SOS response-associated peptidase YedK